MIKVARTNFYGHDPAGYVILIIINIVAFFILNYYYSVISYEITGILSFLLSLLYGGLPVWASIFFIICSLMVLYSSIVNAKVYEDILVFSNVAEKNKKYGIYNFYDVKGKKFACLIYGDHKFVHKKYYKVRRSRYEIRYILGGTRKKFSIPEKENNSFWFTWYLPGGNCIDNLFILPILYVGALTGISTIFQGNIQSIYFLPVYILIGIDLWYKFKNR